MTSHISLIKWTPVALSSNQTREGHFACTKLCSTYFSLVLRILSTFFSTANRKMLLCRFHETKMALVTQSSINPKFYLKMF